LLLLARSAQAQAQGIYNASVNQARRAVANTEAASNRNPDDQSAGQGAPGAQPMSPALVATLKNIANLRADLKALNPTNPVPSALTNDLAAAAGGIKAPVDKVAKLADDLQAAMAGKPALRAHYQNLAQDLHAVFNGSHLNPGQFQMVSDGMDRILDDGGSSYEARQAVLHDIKDIYRATQ
jgi:hypothetical protein